MSSISSTLSKIKHEIIIGISPNPLQHINSNFIIEMDGYGMSSLLPLLPDQSRPEQVNSDAAFSFDLFIIIVVIILFFLWSSSCGQQQRWAYAVCHYLTSWCPAVCQRSTHVIRINKKKLKQKKKIKKLKYDRWTLFNQWLLINGSCYSNGSKAFADVGSAFCTV